MTSGTDISALYREFTDALTEVLAENAVGPARRGRLARARAAVKNYSESGLLNIPSSSRFTMCYPGLRWLFYAPPI
jgi:hypothetical protein